MLEPSGPNFAPHPNDVRSLMRRFPEIDVIATHVEGVSHATVTRPLLRKFARENNLNRLFIPNDGQTIEF